MADKILTVFTPVYNREKLIKRLYKSLINQTDLNFTWLIVDDGSKDKSKEVIEQFIDDNILDIEYIYQENRGKYIAHNTGVLNTKTELFVCVDSDDWLLPNAIEETKSTWEIAKTNENICGIVSPKKIDNVGGLMINPPISSTLMRLYNKKILFGETMLVFKTEILRKYLFPEVPGEKFMSENVIYYQIDDKYSLYVQNKFLYEAEYQGDGITQNIVKTHWNNPNSTLINYEITAIYQESFIKASKAWGCYLAWKKLHKLKSVSVKNVRISVQIMGMMLMRHYSKIFEKQQERMGIEI